MNQPHNQRIIIIGGLSAGPSAAAKARREDENSEIILFEKTAHISYATCGIPYFFSGKIASKEKLMVVKPDLLRERFNIDVHLNEPVINIDVEHRKVMTTLGTYGYDKLIFATGARPFIPPIKQLEKTKNWSHCKTLEDLEKIQRDGMITHAQHVTILGGGLISMEVADNLVQKGKKVTVVELAPTILPVWDPKFGIMAEQVLRSNGVDVRTGVAIDALENHGKKVVLTNGEQFATDYLIIAVGVRPNTDLLLSEGAAHLKNGALIVNEKMETSLPNIYAAGDCASIRNLVTDEPDYFPMGTHSNKGGRAAGANSVGGNEVFKGGYGTGIVSIFEHTLARTGLNAKALRMKNIPFKSTFLIVPNKPGFYTTPQDLFLEIHYHAETRVILGAEIFGEEGVDKRIDVLSTCIYAKLTIDDLQQLDLAYAPPFSPAKDAVIVAGYVAANNGKQYADIQPNELLEQLVQGKSQDYTLIDVRNTSELAKQGMIPGAINIPLDKLRGNVLLVDAHKPIVVYCARGLRGYIASRILAHKGFEKVHNLSGGFMGWQRTNGPIVPMPSTNGGQANSNKQDSEQEEVLH